MRRALVGLLAVMSLSCGGGVVREPALPAPAPASTAPAAKRAMFARAHRHIQRGEFAAAEPLLEALLPSYPALEDYNLHYLARSRAGRGDLAGADRMWARLLSAHPKSLEAAAAQLGRGRVRQARGDLVGAQSLFLAARASDSREVARQATLELAEIDFEIGGAALAHNRLMSLRREAPASAAGRRAKRRIAELRRFEPALVPRGAAREDEARLLLSEGDFAAARGVLARLLATAPADERPELLRLQADAEHGDGDVERGLATLEVIHRRYPRSRAAPEALYRRAMLLWNRDRDREAKTALVDFSRRYPGQRRMPVVLYAIARIEQTAGQAERAVASYERLIRTHPHTNLGRQARWLIGWIHYRQGRWQDAADAFARAERGQSVARAARATYWRARALERAGRSRDAARIYRRIAAEAPQSYYAHWAEQRLGASPHDSRGVAAPPAEARIGAAPPSATDTYHLVRARELHAADLGSLARAELRAFERDNPRRADTVRFLTASYPAVDGYRDAIRVARRSGVPDDSVLYPLAFWPVVSAQTAASNLDPLIVLALMRQESMFDPAARSPANARGLMQLLPSTAERVARRGGSGQPVGNLYDPETNVALGVAYLAGLQARYGGDWLKSLAAYNAGERAVAKWERRFGPLEPDEFVESITYRETRDYLKKVLANYRRYRSLYTNGAAGMD